MAEEFLQGGVCGGSWRYSPRNLFSSSPCSLASSDIGSFGWASSELIMEMKSATPSDDSASDRSSSAPPCAGGIAFSSPAAHHHWNNLHHHQDLLRDSGGLEGNYSTFLQDSSMNYRPQTNKDFSEDSYASSLLQTLFDTDSHNQTSMNYSSSAANPYDQQMNSNGFLLSQPKPSASWNSTAAALNNVPCANFLPSTKSQFIPSSLSSNQKSDIHSISAKEADKELAKVVKRVSHEPPFKRSRIETPSPLPTFKVRKEKLGDRITALQQLVSPFGKTDTASVLHEAIEYIRFLHDQVNALSTPYLKHGSSQRQQGADKPKDQQLLQMDLKTRGLCLVPVSSTFPVSPETATDFWTPTFSGSFRQR